MIVVMVVIVPRMVVAAAAASIAMLMLMVVWVNQYCRQSPLHLNCFFARSIFTFDG